ncbi:MAG: hypothetical protein ABI364_00610 [Caldimonas sp.]
MDRSTRRRLTRSALAIAGVVVVLAVVTWWAGRFLARSQVVVLPAPSLVPVLAAAPTPGGIGLEAVAMAPPPTHAPDEREICGAGWFRLNLDGSPQGDPKDIAARLDLANARRSVLDALRADPANSARAAALLVEALNADDRQRASAPRRPPCEGAGCPASEPRDDGHALLERLAERAAESTDPQLYGYALRSCGHARSEPGTCALLSAAQWTRLDPGNAEPWLQILGTAMATGDAAGRDEALHRIATADRDATYGFVMARVIAEHAPPGDKAQTAAWVLAGEALGVEAAWTVQYQGVSSACSGTALDDANRRQTCAAIAELLVARSDDILARAIGTGLGVRLGWSPDRIDLLRGQYRAFQRDTMTVESRSSGLPCEQVRSELDAWRRKGTLGETGVLREWIAASGRSDAEFIALERERRDASAGR